MVTHISNSPEETERLGWEMGSQARPGEVIGLVGDLGAGKTRFAAGVARGLGIASRVQSPTFALVHEYRQGRLPCHHLDLYRLESASQILGAGLDEFIYQDRGVTLVEWFDRWMESGLPMPRRGTLVRITGEGAQARRITYEHFSA